MNDEASNPLRVGIPPKTTQLSDGTVIITLDDGLVDTTIRPSESLRKQREVYGTAHDLLAEAAELARERTRRPADVEPESVSPLAPRSASFGRETAETKIALSLDLDGTGKTEVVTGVGFFDHMLTLLARHSLIDLTVKAEGDLHVDAHHTVEDVGICFGKALAQALGDKARIRRYGDATVPMDETLVTAAIDLSGRPCCVWKAALPNETLGTFHASLAEEFWRAVSASGAFALHVILHHGSNTHHRIEGIFKATARALRAAVEIDPRGHGVPSTKGVL
jgi:imidazoleglycerol-phosphate dehydratase